MQERKLVMKKTTILMGALCLLLVGCDYTTSLVEKPHLDIDVSIVGVWQRTKADGRTEDLLILPLGDQEYMVSFPAGSADAMFARACLWQGSEEVLLQLDWFGTAQATLPEDDRTFQYASYTVKGDTIKVRLLNPEEIPKDTPSAKALAEAIDDNTGNPNLYREEMVFQKVDKWRRKGTDQ